MLSLLSKFFSKVAAVVAAIFIGATPAPSATTTPPIVQQAVQQATSAPKAQPAKNKTPEALAVPIKAIETPKPKTFTTPSGAVVDEFGNVLNQEEMDLKAQNLLIQQQQFQAQQAVQSQAQQQLQAQQAAQLRDQQKQQQINSLYAEYSTKKLNLEQQIVDRKTKYYTDYAALNESFKGRGVTLAGVQFQFDALLRAANDDIARLSLDLEGLRIEYLNKINAVQYGY